MVKNKTTSRRRNSTLSRKKIITAALRIADKNGIDALSMRRIAQSLQVEAMSLYNHVDNKEDVIDGIVDRIVAKFAVPTDEKDWRKAMFRRAITTHEVLLRHRWASMLLLSRITTGPAMMSYANATIGCLVTAGFSYTMADHACNAIDNHIYGFTLQEINSPVSPDEYVAAAEFYLPQIDQKLYPHIYAMASLIKTKQHSGINDFEFGLNLLLDGLDRYRKSVS